MNTPEKVEFIEAYLTNMKAEFLSEVEDYPDEWDGHELRWYIARAFTAETKWGPSLVARKKAFSKTLQVAGLKY